MDKEGKDTVLAHPGNEGSDSFPTRAGERISNKNSFRNKTLTITNLQMSRTLHIYKVSTIHKIYNSTID